jgi:hypothetical protein
LKESLVNVPTIFILNAESGVQLRKQMAGTPLRPFEVRASV